MVKKTGSIVTLTCRFNLSEFFNQCFNICVSFDQWSKKNVSLLEQHCQWRAVAAENRVHVARIVHWKKYSLNNEPLNRLSYYNVGLLQFLTFYQTLLNSSISTQRSTGENHFSHCHTNYKKEYLLDCSVSWKKIKWYFIRSTLLNPSDK